MSTHSIVDGRSALRAPSAPAIAGRSARRARDPFELGLLALFCALSLWVVGSDVVQSLGHSLVWTHTDGFFAGDQLQYLAWIQSSAHHGLVSDLYVLRATPADYFQPAIILSGLLVRVGMAPWLALMLWKPVAVIGIFLAVRALAHRCFHRTFDIRAALVLGLLFGSLTDVYGSVGVVGDMMPVWQSWGYPFGLIGVALVTFALLGYARAREQRRVAWAPGLLGALAGTVHPWQGELMVLILLGAELARCRDTAGRLHRARHVRGPGRRAEWTRVLAGDPQLVLFVLTLVLVAIPLFYYLGLGHLDAVWTMAQRHSKHSFSASAVAIGAAPLLAFALLGYRGRSEDFLELLLRAWLPAALVIWVLSETALGATPLHAVNGLTLPMAILAIKGVRRSRLSRLGSPRLRASLACLAIGIGTVPAVAYMLGYAHVYTDPTSGNANYITRGESDAMRYLRESPTRGGVLSSFYLGSAVPDLTGRQTFVGDCLWSEPNCDSREVMFRSLLQGRFSDAEARRFVADSGARFLLAGCEDHSDEPDRQLGSLVVSERRFGCATVWQLRTSGPARGPLADVGGVA